MGTSLKEGAEGGQANSFPTPSSALVMIVLRIQVLPVSLPVALGTLSTAVRASLPFVEASKPFSSLLQNTLLKGTTT